MENEIIKINVMQNQFINYNQSLALKKLGFDEKCFGWYSQHKNKVTPHIPCSHNTDYNTVTRPWTTDEFECCSAPLYQQAFRWFRDEYNLVFNFISYSIVKPGEYHWSITWHDVAKASGIVKTYEEAELACLNKLIEIVKNKQD